jgi:LysM repeat protein
MIVLARLYRGALAVLLLMSLDGCLPSGRSQLDEEKESHFLAGKSCVSSMDYKGAIEEFEKAVKANPDSASAHFELGLLYEQKEPDPAAAIYHYEQFLKLRPDYNNPTAIRGRINNCKQDLATTILPLPITPGMQHEFEQLAAENKRLREELEKWKVYAASRLPMPTNAQAQTAATTKPATTSSAAMPVKADQPSTLPSNSPISRPAATRTYQVQTGDTPFSIARKTGVKLEALLAANPGLDPKRLQVGQVLNLPPP